MSGLSKVLVLDPDPRAGRQLQLGFEREGVVATVTQVGVDLERLAVHADGAGLVVVGGLDGRGLDLLRKTRALLDDGGHDLPIVFAGRGVRRSEAEMAGADEVLLAPAHLRDVVTISRMLAGVPGNQRHHVVGSLAETTGVYTLVRALTAIGRSAVLTLIRGLRRGEVRFYHGEVTSAQVGMIHGQAALHQLLLWTDARYDYRHEDVVRRQQIPLSHDELFADAERFLQGVRESAGRLSPAMVLEQDVPRVHSLGKQIPTEVHGVLRMFDGHRVLADVLEDSPYRVFETLRVAQRALEAGLLKIAPSPRPKATWRAVLAIEEWLVGAETRDGVVERTASLLDSQPIDPSASGPIKSTGQSQPYTAKRGKKRGKKRGRANTPLPSSVPAVSVGGGKQEIDWGALVPRIVGAEVGPLAGVVPAMTESGEIVSRREAREGLEGVMDTAARDKIFPRDADAEPTVVWDEIRERAQMDADAAAQALAASAAKAAAEAASAGELAAKQARIKELVEKQRRELEAKAEAAAAVEAQANAAAVATADAKAKADADAEAAAVAVAVAVQAKADAEAKAKADAEAKAKAAADTAAADTAAAVAKAAADQAAIAQIAKAKAEADAAAGARRKAEADAQAAALRPAETSAADLVKQILAEGHGDSELSHRVRLTEPLVLHETPSETVTTADRLTVVAARDTAVVTSVPLVTTVTHAPQPAPQAVVDEPSDGIIQGPLTSQETAPIARPRRNSAPPPPGGYPPPQPEQRGEIQPRVESAAHTKPAGDQPSVLVADLAAAQQAIAAVTSAQAHAPASAEASSKARDAAVAAVRKDAAVAFTDAEEAFFRGGDDKHAPVARAASVESFDDLDEGYKPVSFWDRVRGRGRARSVTSDPPLPPAKQQPPKPKKK